MSNRKISQSGGSSDEDVVRGSKRLMLVDSENEDDNPVKEQSHRNLPPRPSALPRSSLLPLSSSQRRRRSSTRFLNLSRADEGAGRSKEHSRKSLALIYKKEIRMNAENRINSANSWDFKIIDNLEKFLTEDDEERIGENQNTGVCSTKDNAMINFTKASCSLDASVKIYGHRVDNVYLTSYKVLANLNRSHSDKNSKNGDTSNPGDSGEFQGEGKQIKTRKPTGPTVESNITCINVNKLESAFDIDPLFHKMSKNFDEGGAKGLLLVNLGTGDKNCNIVFDTLNNGNEQDDNLTHIEGTDQLYVDCTSLKIKLAELTEDQQISSYPVVGQLAGLRADFAELDEHGFVDSDVTPPNGRKYAPEHESKEEVDRSISQEALDRSRQSAGYFFRQQNSFLDGEGNEAAIFDDGDDGIDCFGQYDEGDERLSSSSFSSLVHQSQNLQTSTVLDAISSGGLLGKSDYQYLDSQALSQISDNAWAGAAHWRQSRTNKKTTRPILLEMSNTAQKGKKGIQYVDLSITPDMTDVLRKPPKAKGKKRSDPLQFTKSVVTKHTDSDNLLPFDARLTVEVFSSLFMRPNFSLSFLTCCQGESRTAKAVAFDLGEENNVDNWENMSYGYAGDDDCNEFSFADNGLQECDEGPQFNMNAELDNVRRVEKIRIGYATVAKKVDVKRLKQDLWMEIESHFDGSSDEKNSAEQTDDDRNSYSGFSIHTPSELDLPLSFYNTVQEMERNKKQADVSLPFYFICILHLANEKGLRLDAHGLDDFTISRDNS